MDLRSLWGLRYRAEFVLQSFAGALASRPVSAPAERFLFHSGYRTQLDESSGGYSSGFQTPLAERFTPPAGALPKRVVFLVNADTVLPPVAAALQAAGDGAIVAEGGLSEDGLVQQRTIDLGEGFLARVRTSEILPQPGWTGLRADAEAASAGSAGSREGDPAFAAALGLLREWPKPAAGAPAAPLPYGAWRPDRRYDEMTEPTLEFRLLAVFKLWTILHQLLPLSPPDRRLGRRAAGVHRPHGAGAGRPRVRPGARRDGGPRQRRPRQPDGEPHARGPLRQDPGAGGHPLDRERLGGDRGRRGREGVGCRDRGCRAHARRRAGRGAGGDTAALLAASTEAGMRRKIADRLLSGPDGSPLALTVRGRGDRVRRGTADARSLDPAPRRRDRPPAPRQPRLRRPHPPHHSRGGRYVRARARIPAP